MDDGEEIWARNGKRAPINKSDKERQGQISKGDRRPRQKMKSWLKWRRWPAALPRQA